MDMLCTSLAFIDGLGAPEMMLIFVLILVLFGGQKLPEFARGIGKSLREFKKAAAGVEEEFKRALDEDERKQNQLKLAENPSTTPSSTTPDTSAGPGASPDPYLDHNHEQHYGDYSHETGQATTQPPATTPPPAPAATEAGPENKILAAAPSAPPVTPAPLDYDDAPAPAAPPAEPAKAPSPAGEAPKAP
jgi:TatA/E family protein of Tat protein translocase